MHVVRESIHTAQKDYECNACLFLDELDRLNGLTFSEKRAIAKANANDRKIKKGEKYLRQFIVSGGDFWDVCSIPEIHKICIKLDVYSI